MAAVPQESTGRSSEAVVRWSLVGLLAVIVATLVLVPEGARTGVLVGALVVELAIIAIARSDSWKAWTRRSAAGE